MNRNTKMLFEAYQEDASNNSTLAIIRPGYYYIGAVYPKNEKNGEQIALVFWSQLDPVFSSLEIFKFDLTTLFNKYSRSINKGINPSQLNGAIINVDQITLINNNYIGYPYKVDWEVAFRSAEQKHFQLSADTDSRFEKELKKTVDYILSEEKQDDKPLTDEEIEEASCENEAEIPEELVDDLLMEELEQQLYDDERVKQIEAEIENELSQILYDNHIADQVEAEMDNELFQLMYDEYREGLIAKEKENEIFQLMYDEYQAELLEKELKDEEES